MIIDITGDQPRLPVYKRKQSKTGDAGMGWERAGGRGRVGGERDVCKERSRASPGYELQVRSNGDRDLAGGKYY